MHYIVVRVGIISHPMTVSVANMLSYLGMKVSVICTKSSEKVAELFDKKIELIEVSDIYDGEASQFIKFRNMYIIRKALWSAIDKIYTNESILWVGHNITIKHLGNKLLRYRYILHLNELNEEIYYSSKFRFLKMNKEKIGNNAIAVVVPEYNRAHITKVLWNLNNLPFILPNKIYIKDSITKKNEIMHSSEAKEILEKIKNRIIILYQGAIFLERNIKIFAQSIGRMGNMYAFVIMSGNLDQIDFNLPANCYLINYIMPPYHLEVTSYASIGILTYTPEYGRNSPLNAIYCAPNKLYEYSLFGIPMLSNDVPALKFIFETNNCGISLQNPSYKSISQAIEKIIENYDYYSSNSRKFYEKTDVLSIVKEISDFTKNRMMQSMIVGDKY